MNNRLNYWRIECFGALALVLTVTADALQKPETVKWQYTTDKPADGWESADFHDNSWKSGPGGFGGEGDKHAPNSVVNTKWESSDIWLRRRSQMKTKPENPALLIYHDDNAEVFLNGSLIAKLEGYGKNYEIHPLNAVGVKALKTGENLLAVHGHQATGGQYIDAHIIDSDAPPDLRSLVGSDGAVHSDLITQWGERITPANAWREYPRPQLHRKQWNNLNGTWDFAVTTLKSEMPTKWTGEILVPFPIESKLSGVRRMLQPYEALWYHRQFDSAPKEGMRTLLHFEAVDYQSKVWLNGKEIGNHTGGNLPFSFDITDSLKTGSNSLVLRVEDATGGYQLTGKQRLSPGGIMYTRNSGIWQTVWTEEVPERRISDVEITSDIHTGEIFIKPTLEGRATDGETLHADASDAGKTVAIADGNLTLKIDQPKLWSPGSPHLYDIRVSILGADGKLVDQIDSYTGMRKVGKIRDKAGKLRFTLNDQPIFHWGPLDQGWWPDGLLTPPADEAMVFEIQWLKEAGFNMIRKHIKVEPRRYYRHCDEIGMLVWQDQVSGGPGPEWTIFNPDPKDAEWPDAEHKQWLSEFDQMIGLLDHFPSIVVWTPFNEAWGQHRSMEIGEWAKKRDPSRMINLASGGNFWPVGDIADRHAYPDPYFPADDKRYDDLIRVVGEFGGHGWPVKDHLWDPSKGNWGYGGLPKTIDEYRQRYEKSISILTDLKSKGISGGVYTQTTDVEEEINGLMTYDRKVIKIPAADLNKLHAPLTAE